MLYYNYRTKDKKYTIRCQGDNTLCHFVIFTKFKCQIDLCIDYFMKYY